MSNNYLTDWEAVENINLIRETAQKVWAENIKFDEIKGINSPYPEFEWFMKLYEQFDVKLTYDRSILVIEAPTEEGYMELSSITRESVFHWFDSMKPENLLHNFQVLDRLIQKNNI